jgi:hypothetical protein
VSLAQLTSLSAGNKKITSVVPGTNPGEVATYEQIQNIQALIPAPYTHPDTHPANMITGLGSAAMLNYGTDANNVVVLDFVGKIPVALIPDTLLGQVSFQGVWNASTNSPSLPQPATSKGMYFVVTFAGTYMGTDYDIGDWAICDGTTWNKVDNTDAIKTVFGRIGNIVPEAFDYAAFYADKTDTQQRLSSLELSLPQKADSSAVVTALLSKADISYVNGALSLKADASSLAAKADITYVDNALAPKADTTAMTAALALKADSSAVIAALATKANTSDVNAALALKTDNTTTNALDARISSIEAYNFNNFATKQWVTDIEQTTAKLILCPEFPNTVFSALGITDTLGTMTTDSDGANNYNYYRWTSAESTMQAYGMVTMIQKPKLFNHWTACKLYYKASGTGSITFTVYDTLGNIVGTATGGTNSDWTELTIADMPGLNGGNWTGDMFKIITKLEASNNGSVWLSNIVMDYQKAIPA